MARSLIFQVPNGPQGRGYIIQALLIIVDHLPRRFAQFKLVADFLEPRSESFNLFLLPGYSRFLLLELPVLFKELVKQHRVYCLVADSVDFAFGIASYQIRIHFCDVLGHQAKLRDAVGIKRVFVAEENELRQQHLAQGRYESPLIIALT